MVTARHAGRSLVARLGIVLFSTAVGLGAQEMSVQKLLERGALEEAVERAGDGSNPEATFLAAQALIKLSNNEGANERFARLRDAEDEAWKAIGESGAALIEGNVAAAMDAANRAVAADDDNPYAHYQLGLAAGKEGNYQRAAAAFSRSADIKPDLAYAHYYAGQSYQRTKQIPKMAEHFRAFVHLAPDAPERGAVQAILRSLR